MKKKLKPLNKGMKQLMNNGLKSEAIMKRILRKLARDAVKKTCEVYGINFSSIPVEAQSIAEELVP